MLSSANTRFSSSPQLKILLGCTLLYLLSLLYLRGAASRDPTSIFFRPDIGFQRHYSLRREIESDAFIEGAKAWEPYHAKSSRQTFCVTIPTFGRGNVSYFDSVLGSLLDGLTEAERQDIYVMPLIAHADPQNHTAFKEPWLANLSDEVLTYNDTVKDFARVEYLERTEEGHRKKSLYDYKYALQSCYKVTSAPYILLLEDDILAAKGWYPYLKRHLPAFEQRNENDDALYLRLFYTEKNFGWNKEEGRTYFYHSLLFWMFIAGCLLGLRTLRPSGMLSHLFTFSAIATILVIFVPAFVALYFAAGRVTVSPMPHGVHAMERFGCCSQAMLFPRDRIPDLAHRFDLEISKPKRYDPPDALIESYADSFKFKRWALTPVMVQHVGTESGKLINKTELSKWARPRAANIWNFEFETYWDKQWPQ